MLLLSKDFDPKKEATLSERGRSIPLHLVPSFDCDDDFVGVLGPGKGPGVCIGVIEEVVDGVFELLEGPEHAALEALFGEFGKETLDGVEPGGRCRSEVEYEPRIVFDPLKNLGVGL